MLPLPYAKNLNKMAMGSKFSLKPETPSDKIINKLVNLQIALDFLKNVSEHHTFLFALNSET